MEEQHGVIAPPGRKTKELTNQQRETVVIRLLELCHHGQLPRGSITNISVQFDVTRQTISRIWNKYVTARENGNESLSVVHKEIFQRRGNFKYDIHELNNAIQKVDYAKRGTFRDLADELKISKSILWKTMSEGGICSHSSTVKPSLTEENRIHRFYYCCDEIKDNGLFKDMYNRIHLDEKWFFIDTVTRRIIMAVDEEPLYRSTPHKSHIDKIMFLCAVARPRYNPYTKQIWDGKIGIWPIATLTPAARNSANRPAGTLEWKSYNLSRTFYRDMLINKVIPAIHENWPMIGGLDETIWLQQDNAPVHIKNDDAMFREACDAAGLHLQLYNQPPNSPDLNILDLGFFNSLQSMVQKHKTRNKGELVYKVLDCFAEYPHHKINNVFLSLQKCMEQIILSNGGNYYELQHMNKQQLERNGSLPTSILASADVLAAMIPPEP